MSNKKSLLKKRRRRSIIAFEMIRLDRTSIEPLHQQLYRQIRDELRSGSFMRWRFAASFLTRAGCRPGHLQTNRQSCVLKASRRRLSSFKGQIGDICSIPSP